MATVSPAWWGAFLGPMFQAQMGTAEGSWALGLWKVLWREWWTMEVGSSGTLGLRRLVHCD